MHHQGREIVIEDARIIFRNFEGKEDKFNKEGDRNFTVVLDEPDALELQENGWNVKSRPPREEGDEAQYYLKVAVSYRNRPPRIVTITSKGRNPLDEEDVDTLDWADLKSVDLTLTPYDWKVNGNTGRKAYLKTGFFILNEDFLELKYSDVPEIGSAQQHLAITADVDSNLLDLDPDEVWIEESEQEQKALPRGKK